MTEMLLPVTFTFVSFLAITLIPMTGWIGVRRDKVGGVLRGDGDDPVLFKRIRVHGNLMENAPIFILVLAASEYAGLSAYWLWLAVSAFLAGRVLHFVLYDHGKRGLSMLVTLIPGLLMGVWLLTQIWF